MGGALLTAFLLIQPLAFSQEGAGDPAPNQEACQCNCRQTAAAGTVSASVTVDPPGGVVCVGETLKWTATAVTQPGQTFTTTNCNFTGCPGNGVTRPGPAVTVKKITYNWKIFRASATVQPCATKPKGTVAVASGSGPVAAFAPPASGFYFVEFEITVEWQVPAPPPGCAPATGTLITTLPCVPGNDGAAAVLKVQWQHDTGIFLDGPAVICLPKRSVVLKAIANPVGPGFPHPPRWTASAGSVSPKDVAWSPPTLCPSTANRATPSASRPVAAPLRLPLT